MVNVVFAYVLLLTIVVCVDHRARSYSVKQSLRGKDHHSSAFQHPIVPEFDKSLKSLFSQIPKIEEIEERYQDYQRRMQELEQSPNVQSILAKTQQQQQLSPSFRSPVKDNVENVITKTQVKVTSKNTHANSTSTSSPPNPQPNKPARKKEKSPNKEESYKNGYFT
jgi:hypothetical protein